MSQSLLQMFDSAEILAEPALADSTAPAPRAELDDLEIALCNVSRAERRLKMIKALSDMSLHLAEIVYRRAVREAAAAERAAALADDAVCEDVRPAPAIAASPAAASAEAGDSGRRRGHGLSTPRPCSTASPPPPPSA
jgi:hypothetical protein